MTDSGRLHSTTFDAEDDLDYLFGNANPNPSRAECPSRDELIRMSHRAIPIGDRVYVHVVGCSPCFREMRGLQQSRARRRKVRTWAIAAAAVVALILGGSVWIQRSP